MADQQEQAIVKVKGVMIGDFGVGKSRLLLRETENGYTDSNIRTREINLKIKTYVSNGKVVTAHWYDTADREQFRDLEHPYYRDAQVAFLVYDVTDEDSFKRIGDWMNDIGRYTDDIPIVLIGNKCDLANRVVETQRGQTLASRYEIPFFETSAKDNINVNAAFAKGLDLVVKRLFPAAEEQPQPQQQPALAQPEAQKISGWLWALMTLTMIPIWLYGVYKIFQSIGKGWKGEPAEPDAIPGWQWALMTVTCVPMVIYGVYKIFQSIGDWWKAGNAAAVAQSPAASPNQFASLYEPLLGERQPLLQKEATQQLEADTQKPARKSDIKKMAESMVYLRGGPPADSQSPAYENNNSSQSPVALGAGEGETLSEDFEEDDEEEDQIEPGQ